MADAPETRFARSADGRHVAYQVSGRRGGIDLVLVESWFSHVDALWEVPSCAAFYRRLGSFARLVRFDKRGTGASDPLAVGTFPTLEQWMDDVRTVMDAIGLSRAAVCGLNDGGLMAMLFAASHPDRVSALVLGETAASFQRRDGGLGLGVPPEDFARTFRLWGHDEQDRRGFNPSGMDEDEARIVARIQRSIASPGTAKAILNMLGDVDVAAVLPAIQAPTLVIHRRDDSWLPLANARHLAEHIPGARLSAIPGADHFYHLGDPEPALAEIEEFLTGSRHDIEPDRMLATVLFTDIVGSTEMASRLGDRRWREVLDRHDEVARREIERRRGRLVNTTGDGILATFDGPARAIDCARQLAESLSDVVALRAGLHTGEVELRGNDIGGIAVHLAARVASVAGAGEVLVSRTVVDLVAGSELRFEDRGDHRLKGVAGEWRLFAVTEASA